MLVGDVKDAAVEGCENILKKYAVSSVDIETISDMIKTPYNLLAESYYITGLLEDCIKEYYGDDALIYLMQRVTAKKREEIEEHLSRKNDFHVVK
jgi:hypothetical protein